MAHRLVVSASLGAAMIPTWPGKPPRVVCEGADASVKASILECARRVSDEACEHQNRGVGSIDVAVYIFDGIAMRSDGMLVPRGVEVGVFVGEVATEELGWSQDRN